MSDCCHSRRSLFPLGATEFQSLAQGDLSSESQNLNRQHFDYQLAANWVGTVVSEGNFFNKYQCWPKSLSFVSCTHLNQWCQAFHPEYEQRLRPPPWSVPHWRPGFPPSRPGASMWLAGTGWGWDRAKCRLSPPPRLLARCKQRCLGTICKRQKLKIHWDLSKSKI